MAKNKKIEKKYKILIGITLIILSLAIGYSAISDFSSYYRSVEEVTDDPDYYSTHEVNIKGVIVNGTFKQTEARQYTFQLIDNNATMDVKYNAALPQTFDRNSTLVLTGRMNGTVFETSEMQVKCPTKYEPET